MTEQTSRLASLIVCLVLALHPAGAAAERHLALDDLLRLADVDDAQPSPDGRWIAYTVTRYDAEDDSSETRIWMVAADGDEPVPLTSSGHSSSHPRWTADGRHLAFLSTRPGTDEDDDEAGGQSQVYTLFRQGGEAVRRTSLPQGVESFETAPNGDLVLLVRDPESEKQAHLPEETPRPWVVRRLQIKVDYKGYLDERRTHLYVLDLDAADSEESLRQLTSGPYDDADPAVSPDGRWVAFVSNRDPEPDDTTNTDVWVVPFGGGEPRRLTSSTAGDSQPAWSPDSKALVYTADRDVQVGDYALRHLNLVDLDGNVRELTRPLDRNADTPAFDADGSRVFFSLEDDGEQWLASVPTAGGDVQKHTGERDVLVSFQRSTDGIAAVLSRPHLPPEVFLLPPAGAPRQLTRTNAAVLDGVVLGDVAEVRFTSRDGTPIQGFVVKPPDFEEGRRYPTLLRIHGGPMAQYDARFDFEKQLYAAHGYLVVLPNPRGSTGFGQEFTLAIWRDWGGPDGDDVLAAVDDVIARGWADPERLGVGGHSYGGMLTNHLITRTERFKAAIPSASATLYISNYGHDQYQNWWEGELGLPWQTREHWDRLSPFFQVEKIRTPTLLICGEKDWNVPVINSEQMYQALRRLGRTTELVVYPGEHHGIARPSYRVDFYKRSLEWYARFVLGQE